MSTLTKEWLQQTIAELEEERDAVPGVVNEDAANALAAMKLALASLESGGEACEACGGNGSVDIDHGEMGIEHIECPKFYTSQPAPVSVPEWTNEQCLEFLADDELLEVTPKTLRLRKRILNHEIRMKALKGNKKYQNL